MDLISMLFWHLVFCKSNCILHHLPQLRFKLQKGYQVWPSSHTVNSSIYLRKTKYTTPCGFVSPLLLGDPKIPEAYAGTRLFSFFNFHDVNRGLRLLLLFE